MAIAAPSSPYVVNYADMRLLDFPVSGAGANLPVGTPMMPGVTAGTNLSVAIPVTATSNADILGILAEPHVFSGTGSSGDATTATLVQWFAVGAFSGASYQLGIPISGGGGPLPSHKLDLIDTFVGVKMDYAIADASSMTITHSSTTVIGQSSAVAGYDGAFIYFTAGTAIGELGFIKSSVASTSFTLSSALTVDYSASDTAILINPLFNALPTFLIQSATVPTKLDTNPAAGTATCATIANFIAQNGLVNRLDPKLYHKVQNLQKLNTLGFFAYLAFQDTIFHPGS